MPNPDPLPVPMQRTHSQWRSRSGPKRPRRPGPLGVRSLQLRAVELLRSAQECSNARDRYLAAYLAAARAARAILLSRAALPTSGKPASVWALLAAHVPQLADWSEFFAGRARSRAAAQAGARRPSDVEVELMVRRAAEFVQLVQRSLEGIRE